jgi:ribosomal protein S18 acetylase RimI-like enzyme
MSTLNNPEPPSLHQEKHKNWTRDGFLISTDPSLISVQSLSDAFAQNWMYWAKPLPPSTMTTMIHNSLNFGLYTPTPQSPAATQNADPISTLTSEERPGVSRPNLPGRSMVGYARVITDEVTFAYLTDVYVLPGWQGEGLGKWLIECVQEIFEALPHLRRTFLITGRDGPAVGFYEKLMKMEKLDEGSGGKLIAMTWRGPGSSFLRWAATLDNTEEDMR